MFFKFKYVILLKMYQKYKKEIILIKIDLKNVKQIKIILFKMFHILNFLWYNINVKQI